jgi:hypothetical protein
MLLGLGSRVAQAGCPRLGGLIKNTASSFLSIIAGRFSFSSESGSCGHLSTGLANSYDALAEAIVSARNTLVLVLTHSETSNQAFAKLD